LKSIRIGDLLLEYFVPTEKKHPHSLLFIHGMYGGAWGFRDWAEVAVEAGWEVWVINLRGHHDSRPVEDFGKVSLMDYVEDVEDVLKHIGPAVLIGHSMGALVVQIVADLNPDIPAVVLCSSAASHRIFPGSWGTISRYWKLRYLMATGFNKPLHPHKGDTLSLVFNSMSSEEAEKAFLQFVPESGRAVKDVTYWPILGRELKMGCPTLVVGAIKDRLTPVRIQKAIARKYNANYKEFSGTHALPIEDGWEKPIKFILNWAAENVK